jgi:F-type H+-transporting ATPase subunit a
MNDTRPFLAANNEAQKPASEGHSPTQAPVHGSEPAAAGHTEAAGNQAADHEATSAASNTHGTETHGAHDVPPSQVFTHLLGELGDHHGFVLFDHVMDLPMILVDKGSVDVYASEHSMEAAGKYVLMKGQPVRKADMKPVDVDVSVTNYVFFQWMAMLLLFVVMRLVVGKYKKYPMKAPSGLQNAIEALVVYLRDTVVYANIPIRKAADRLMPYFLTAFFFILTLNLFGLLPGGHTATGSLSVTSALAITAFLVINWTGIREAGLGHWLAHLTGGTHWALWIIMIPVEVLGLFTKPFALAMRLFANMSAGHMVLLVLMGLIFFFKSWLVAPLSVGFSLFIHCLELLVVFLQAYIFTTLTAVFTGLAIGEAHDHH